MTDHEWLTCADPHAMLKYLHGKASDRKLRLFACACCRRVWHLLTDERSRKVVETTERYVDGLASESDLRTAAEPARAAAAEGATVEAAAWAAETAALAAAAKEATWAAEMASVAEEEAARAIAVAEDTEERCQCALLRDIFGNPFRPIAIEPSWLRWNDSRVVRLAQIIYEERGFGNLPLLADALEEAGCDDEDILGHCCSPEDHVRGCWVVDALLGKS